MADRPQDAAFTQLVTSSRDVLLGAAQLMSGQPDRAEDVVQVVLAELYRDWPPDSDPRDVALRRVLQADPRRLHLPWRRTETFELLDTSADRPLIPPGILSDLADLAAQPRRVVILDRWVGLSLPQIAALLGVSVAAVTRWSAEATERLVARDPDRRLEQQLREELAEAVSTAPPADATADLAHGRSLVRRRGRRWLLVAAALIVALILGASQLGPGLQPEHNEARDPVPGPARSAGGCDPTDTACRTAVLRDWRSKMAAVTDSYLDPEGSYFSGYTFSADDDLYETPGFWNGAGALGFDMFKLGGGSTDVYVQIATDEEYAVRCGETTQHACTPASYQDHLFALTQTSNATEGLELQYAATDNTVITLIARDTAGGLTLGVTRVQLIRLALDQRLRLPVV